MIRKALLVLLFVMAGSYTSLAGIQLLPLDSFETGIFDDSAAEIVAYDSRSRYLFVVNASEDIIDILDIRRPYDIREAIARRTRGKIAKIDVSKHVPGSGGINSVDVYDGLVAVAVQNDDESKNGFIAFYQTNGFPRRLSNGKNYLEVGNLPDAVKFSHDGKYIISSNEGEPGDDFDPKGSISIIEVKNGRPQVPATTLDFTAFDPSFTGLKLDPGKLLSDDVEPEFAAFSHDNKMALVTLQEANGFAIVDVGNKAIVDIKPLGFKDHSVPGNGLDASNEDGVINIQNWPVYGMYQPDGIESYEVNGESYFVTANEGDARDPEEERVKDVVLDPAIFPNAAVLQMDENLGRLHITNILGNKDADAEFEELYAFGARSFTIWDKDGNLVFVSGDQIEQITASLIPNEFNSTNDDNNSFDNRSDDKGPEPENLAIGEVNGKHYAFIGLERVGGIIVFDITNPFAPIFVQYINNRNFSADAEDPATKDLGPEGVEFIPADKSPTGDPLLAVGNEVSGTTTVYKVRD